MTPELLDTFLDHADSRSFNRTAERMGISQSTVSARIKALEEALGEKLFSRSRAGTRPTAAGERFEAHARTLRHGWAAAQRAVRRAGERDGVLRIGLQHDLAAGSIADWVGDIREAFPKTELYVEIDYSTQMNADVLSGTLDFAVLFTPRPLPDLHYDAVGELRYVMVSTHARRLAEVDPARTIRANYAPAFDTAHRMLYPQLELAPVGAGLNTGVAALIRVLEGSGYVMEQTAAEMAAAGETQRVEDAEPITQPVYTAVHLRNRTSGLHRKLSALVRRHFS
jgi:DNA-binding transcriptional LysR family regulator